MSAFGKVFIKTGLFPAELHRYLRDAFKFRQLGDYGAPGSVSSDRAHELIKQAKEFIETIEEYLRKEGYSL
ncbi:MAG: HEPN domain-containing protein [bacterium]